MQVAREHFGAGPVWRAEDVLRRQGEGRENEWMHQGEYLVMYRLEKQAIVSETLVYRGGRQSAAGRAVRVIGGNRFGAIGDGRP